MRRLSAGALCLVVLVRAGAADIAYTGDEAFALDCADMFATAAVELEDEMTPEERAKVFTTSVYILSEYVSGSWAQKDAAMKIVTERRSNDETVAEYRQRRRACLSKFPVRP